MAVQAEPEIQIGTVAQSLHEYQQAAARFRLERECLGEMLDHMVGKWVDVEGSPSEVRFAHGRDAGGDLKFYWKPLQNERVRLTGRQILAFERARGLLVAALDVRIFNPTLANSFVPYAYRFPLDGIVNLVESSPDVQTM